MTLSPMMPFFGFAMTTVDLLNGSDGSYVGGLWVPGASASNPINIISPQPVKANDLVMTEDGEHLADFLKSWTEDETIFTRDRNKDSSLLTWDGETYKVTQVSKRKLGTFRKFIIKRVG